MKLGKDLGVRVIFFKAFIILIYSLLLTRLVYLQIIKGDYYLKLSQDNRMKIKRINAPRGKIYDRTGKLLVTNLPGYKLVYLDGRNYDQKILANISGLVDMPIDAVEKKLKYGEIFQYTGENEIISDLPVEKAHKIMENLDKYPYLDVVTYSKRNYVYDTFASHTIGYVKPITKKEYEDLKDKGYTRDSIVGKKGIEKSYDNILQGQDGLEYIEVNAYNKVVKNINNVEPVPGKELVLSLDYRLQEHMMETMTGKMGAFIAVNVKTGEILTILSNPEYSLNKFSSRFTTEEWSTLLNDPLQPLYNRAISSTYPPGSVYKVVSSLSFLEDGIDPDMTIFDPGYFQLGKFRYRSWKKGGHGVTNMAKSLIESVNVYYYMIINQLGIDTLEKVSKSMGLGQYTGIDLLEEKKGIMPSPEWKKERWGQKWYPGDSINLSIGQGYLLTTPLQILNIYTIIANKGYSYKPRIVKEIVDNDGKKHDTKKEIAFRYDTKEEYYDTITNALIQTVEKDNGTAKALRTPGLQIAAKTGSAQNAQQKSKDDSHAWTAGFFPAKNPEIAFVAFVENGGGGGAVSGPIAKAFVDKYLELYKGRIVSEVTKVAESH